MVRNKIGTVYAVSNFFGESGLIQNIKILYTRAINKLHKITWNCCLTFDQTNLWKFISNKAVGKTQGNIRGGCLIFTLLYSHILMQKSCDTCLYHSSPSECVCLRGRLFWCCWTVIYYYMLSRTIVSTPLSEWERECMTNVRAWLLFD
jgi:hypothetical protein